MGKQFTDALKDQQCTSCWYTNLQDEITNRWGHCVSSIHLFHNSANGTVARWTNASVTVLTDSTSVCLSHKWTGFNCFLFTSTRWASLQLNSGEICSFVFTYIHVKWMYERVTWRQVSDDALQSGNGGVTFLSPLCLCESDASAVNSERGVDQIFYKTPLMRQIG